MNNQLHRLTALLRRTLRHLSVIKCRAFASGSSLRIIHGFTSGAGQPGQIAAYQRGLGFHAAAIHIGANKMGFAFDRVVNKATYADRANIFRELLTEFNVFHFYGFPLFGWKHKIEVPFGIDLLTLRLLKIPVIMNFRGSEVRQKDIFERHTKYAFSDGEDHGLFKAFPWGEQRRYIDFCREFATRVIVPDAELASYVPGSIIVPRAIDIVKWKNYGQVNSSVPLVVHAPTRRNVKGTEYVIRAVERLRAKGLRFDFKLVEGLSNSQAAAIYEKSDIIIDQLKIGWHGVLSTEAMALGKVAMCYIRDDLVDALRYEGRLPLVNINQDSIEVELEKLIKNPQLRIELGNFGRIYVEKIHDIHRVSRRLIGLYNEAMIELRSDDKPSDINQCIEFVNLYCDSAQFSKSEISRLSTKILRLSGSIGKTGAIPNSRVAGQASLDGVQNPLDFINALKFERLGHVERARGAYAEMLSAGSIDGVRRKYVESRARYLSCRTEPFS